MIALVISVAITSLFYVRISRQQKASRPKTRKIVGTATALQPGAPLTAANLVEIDWPEAIPLESAVTKRDDVVGRVLLYPIGAHEPLLLRDVASPNSSLGLAAKIPDGMRATAIRTNEVNNVAGFLFPGCRVDVLLTLRGEGNTTVTRTVLQNVQVLSAGTKMQPDPEGKPDNVNVITLLVTPEESEKLALAESQGTIQFVLRNGGDSAMPQTAPVSLTDLTGGQKAAPPPPELARAVKHAAAKYTSRVLTVETIAGEKSSVAKFETGKEQQ